jgi:O-antigen/teichoic acid export membrane protein
VNSSSTATRATGWRGAIRADQVLAHNLVLGAGTMAAGVLGVAFQSIVSHRLQPADYGAVFAVVSLVTLIGLPAGALTLLMAREASRDLAQGTSAASGALLRGGNRVAILAGLALAAVLAVGSPILGRFLNVPAELLLATAAGVPFAFASPLLMGELQGEQRFLALSLLGVSQAGLKLIAAIGLGLVFGPFGIIAGISIAGAVVYAVVLWMLWPKLSINSPQPWRRPAVAYLGVVVPSTLALAVLLSTDVLLVKHFFPARAAGEYAAVAAMGRAIFWGASGVAAVLFPKVVVRRTQGQRGSSLVVASLLLVAVGGILGLVLLSIASRWLLTAFAGAAYVGAVGYLPWYALGMTLLGGVAVLIATHQSDGKSGFLAILVPLTLLEPALIAAFHQNLTQVVQVVDVSMSLVLIGLAALYVAQHRGSRLVGATANGSPNLPPIPQTTVMASASPITRQKDKQS